MGTAYKYISQGLAIYLTRLMRDATTRATPYCVCGSLKVPRNKGSEVLRELLREKAQEYKASITSVLRLLRGCCAETLLSAPRTQQHPLIGVLRVARRAVQFVFFPAFAFCRHSAFARDAAHAACSAHARDRHAMTSLRCGVTRDFAYG